MAKKKGADRESRHDAGELASIDSGTTAPTPAAPATAQREGRAWKADGTVNKSEAIREAIDELGQDAQPADIVAFVKERYSIEITSQAASTGKFTYKRKQGATPGKRGRKPKAESAAAAPTVATNEQAPSLKLAQAVATIRTLVADYGAEEVAALAHELAKR